MYQLTDNDAQLLAFISTDDNETPVAVMRDKFPNMKALDQRLRTLTSKDVRFLEQGAVYHTPETDGYYREDLGIYTITPQGMQALEDFQRSDKRRRKELWLKSVWLPMLVAFGTTLLTQAAKEWLLPMIQRLV